MAYRVEINGSVMRGGREVKVAIPLETAPETPREEAVIKARSPLLGARLHGRVLMTLVDGALVHHDRQRLPWPVPTAATETAHA